MSVECFLDTNILVYAVDAFGVEPAKRTVALELVDNARFGTSGQVLQEFFVTSTRKGPRPLTVIDALEWLEQFEQFPCVAVGPALIKAAVEISQRHKISYWDGAIIAAAEALGAATLYTEDLNHGQRYGPVRAVDPFRAS